MLNNGWLRTLGNTGWYSETHGGGWYMIDSTWIRSYNSKNVYVDAQLRSDGGLTSLGNTQLGDTGTDVTTISGWATTGNLHSSGKVWSPLIAGARVHSSGDITGLNRLFLTAGSYASNHYSASDERYKKDIETIESASEKLSEIRGVTYLLRRDEFPEMQFSEGRQTGFIAQEIQKTFPELVVENPRTGYLNVDYSKFTAVLVEAFKEQQAIIAKNKEMFEIMRDGMNAKNAEQDARIEKLEQENKELRDEVRALSRRLDEIIKKLED